MLRTELALLRTEPGFPRLQKQVRDIAGLLEEYPTIPAVARELDLIAEVQTDEWWVDVTLPMLEKVRTRLRLLVPFIQRSKREPLYSDFEDQIGEGVEVDLGGLATAGDFERFRRKARAFLAEHKANTVIEKIHRNWPITALDLAELAASADRQRRRDSRTTCSTPSRRQGASASSSAAWSASTVPPPRRHSASSLTTSGSRPTRSSSSASSSTN